MANSVVCNECKSSLCHFSERFSIDNLKLTPSVTLYNTPLLGSNRAPDCKTLLAPSNSVYSLPVHLPVHYAYQQPHNFEWGSFWKGFHVIARSSIDYISA